MPTLTKDTNFNMRMNRQKKSNLAYFRARGYDVTVKQDGAIQMGAVSVEK